MSDDEIFRIQAHIEAMTQDKQNAEDLLKEQRGKPMTPNIEQTARKCAEELVIEREHIGFNKDATATIARHLTTHTKDLEDENKRLREALERSIRALRLEFGGYNWRLEEAKLSEQALTKPA